MFGRWAEQSRQSALMAASVWLLAGGAVQAQDVIQPTPGDVLDAWHAAASRADGEAYFSHFAPDARFIGTDATERWTVGEFRAYAAPHFSKGRGWTYLPRDRVVVEAEIDCRCIVFFDELLDNAAYGVVRGSGVLRLTDDGWKIEQYVLSFTIPNAAARDVVALLQGASAPE